MQYAVRVVHIQQQELAPFVTILWGLDPPEITIWTLERARQLLRALMDYLHALEMKKPDWNKIPEPEVYALQDLAVPYHQYLEPDLLIYETSYHLLRTNDLLVTMETPPRTIEVHLLPAEALALMMTIISALGDDEQRWFLPRTA